MNRVSIGDVVKIKEHEDNHGKGLIGEVVCFKCGFAGIRFEEQQSWMHNLHDKLSDKRGWFVEPDKLELNPLLKPYDPTQGNEEDDI